MAINVNDQITWVDFITACFLNIKDICCNIDTYKDVPENLRAGATQTAVKTLTTSVNAGGTAKTYTWYANPSNLIDLVSSDIVNSEWITFLTDAGIDTRSNKIIQANDLTLAVGLFMQFMSYHVKLIYSRRQVYDTVTAQTVFQSSKYVTGTVAPKYTLAGINANSIPTITDANITNIVNQNFTANELIKKYSNQSISRYQLS